MATARLRFYEELNDFLPPVRRKQTFTISFQKRNSIKDMIESTGVPHTEVDLILVNGESVDFSYIVLPNDRISIYPMFESFDIAPLNRLRPKPLRRTRFVLDTHLGKLSRYMRLLGFDTLYSNAYEDEQLANISAAGDKRILLTRDHGLLKRKLITHAYFIRETEPMRQAREVLIRFDLHKTIEPFLRCIRCNEYILRTTKQAIIDRVPEKVIERFNDFSHCPGCLRVYWKGSHYQRLISIIENIIMAT